MVKVTVVIFISCLQTPILYSSNLDTAPVWCILFGVYWMLMKFFLYSLIILAQGLPKA